MSEYSDYFHGEVEWRWFNRGRENAFIYLYHLGWNDKTSGEEIAARILQEWFQWNQYSPVADYRLEILTPSKFKGVYSFTVQLQIEGHRIDPTTGMLINRLCYDSPDT